MTLRPIASLVLVLLAGCASITQQAEQLARAGQPEQAYALLDRTLAENPGDTGLRTAWLRQRELVIAQLANQTDAARAAGRLAEARDTLARLQAIDAQHPRSVAARQEIERAERHERWLAQANTALAAGRDAEADGLLRQLTAEAPGHPGARAAQLRLRERRKPAEAMPTLGPAFQKPVTIEFRDAPLRSVLEGLARTHGINFVFDKDVRADTRISILLRDVALDEALRVLLTTQQLERKLLNENTVLIYPATAAKQREHQELATRSFYLVNTDVKQAQAMVRTLAKSRDLFVDERLNLLVVRDTPDVLRQIERLLGALDLPEPEVLLELEVVEISSNKIDELGIDWPAEISYGLPSFATEITRANRDELRASVANPLAVARLRETVSRGNVLANPRLRARNHEKARILVGEKLPVFASSAGSVGIAPATTVTYLDVGLKLEIEPSVQLDNDVVMKVGLEVSTLIAKVAGPNSSVGYQVGTRQANTSLRLRDGETQVLAGLIRAEDSKGIAGLPVLADLPVAGRLFGVHTDQRIKTEVVLLITPRVVRNIGLPAADIVDVPSGVDANPGAEPLRLRSRARVSLAPSGAAPAARPTASPAEPAAPEGATIILSTSGQVAAGGTAAVTLQNRSGATLSGDLVFDAKLLAPVTPGGEPGRLPFKLMAGAEQVLMFQVLEPAAGQSTTVSLSDLRAEAPDGSAPPPLVQGDGNLAVAPK